LTPRQRLRLARQVVDDGWSVSAAADYFRVSYPTAAKWARRYVELGADGMLDRSSRPHRHPNKTPQPVVKRIVHLRIKKRLGPVQIAGRLDLPASTVHSVLVSCKLNRLSHVDVKTGEPARRYEHEKPGALIHVDVKKLGNIPDGGGWRIVGRAQGWRNREATPNKPRNVFGDKQMGHAYVHTVIDDHSRIAYAEIHDDEKTKTAVAVLRRAMSWFTDRGVTVERVISDNGPAYKSDAWRDTCAELGIRAKRTRPYRPQNQRKDRALSPHAL
jgi:transposase InsO family protein